MAAHRGRQKTSESQNNGDIKPGLTFKFKLGLLVLKLNILSAFLTFLVGNLKYVLLLWKILIAKNRHWNWNMCLLCSNENFLAFIFVNYVVYFIYHTKVKIWRSKIVYASHFLNLRCSLTILSSFFFVLYNSIFYLESAFFITFFF